MKKWGLLIGFLFSWLPSAFAAETMTLTLQDALILALKNNLSLKAESFNRDIAYSGIMIQKGEFDPFFGTEFAESALKTQSPYYSFTILNPEQKVIDFNAFLRGKATTGTGYELRWNNERFRGDSSVLKINPYYKSELSLTLRQPILKGFGIDVQRARVYASEYTYEISKLNYTDASEEIALRTITAYWTVVASKSNLEVFELSLSLAQKIHEEVKAKIRAGLLAQVEVYQAEAEIAVREEGILSAQNALNDSVDALRNILNLENWGTELETADSPPEASTLPGEDESLKSAFVSRKDYKSARLETQSREILYTYYKNQRLPEVNLFGSAGLNGLENEYGEALDDIGTGDYYSWEMGLSITIPLWNDFGQGNYRKAKYELDQSTQRLLEIESSIRLQVRQKLRALDLTIKRIYATEKTMEAAKKRYEAEEGRFRVGLAILSDVITFQREYLQALANYRISKVQYAVALADFRRTEGTLLDVLSLNTP